MNRISSAVIFGFSLLVTALSLEKTDDALKVITLLSTLLTIASFILFVIAYLKKD